MENTALVTFMLQHATAKKVELLGSWDNFCRPYGMERDKRRGRGIWTGCHTFHDIICDGDEEGFHEKRAGGLKMGGTYWYFYRVDDEGEIYDQTQDTTTACPLMPGQTLNVLDVPWDADLRGGHHRSASLVSLLNVVKTLNPEDRYTNPKPMPQPETKIEATAPTRHIHDASSPSARQRNQAYAAPNFSAKYPMRHGRSKSDHIPSDCAQPNYSASCAHRPIKSAPTSPRCSTLRFDASLLPHVSAHETVHAHESLEGQDPWAVRDSISGGQSHPSDIARMMQSFALDEDGTDDTPVTDLLFLDRWPLAQDTLLSTQDYASDDVPAATRPAKTHALSATAQQFVPSSEHITLLHRTFPNHPNREPPPPPPGAPETPSAMSPDAPTPPISLLPQRSYMLSDASNMRQGLQALNEQYTIDRHNVPWRSQTQPEITESLASSVALISNVASPIFSSIPGDASDTTTSYRLSELREFKASSFADFDFNLEETPYTSNAHVYSSFEHLSVHTTESADSTSTVMPYQLPDANSYAGSKVSLASTDQRELREAAAKLYELTHGTSDDLLDEFEYLGAALL